MAQSYTGYTGYAAYAAYAAPDYGPRPTMRPRRPRPTRGANLPPHRSQPTRRALCGPAGPGLRAGA